MTILSRFGALWQIRSVLRSLLTRLADPDMCSSGQQGRLLHFCTCWHHWSLNVLVTFCPECRARLVFSARKSEHTIPLVHEPHWLRVPECIPFHGTAPVYLAESLHRTTEVRARHCLRCGPPTICLILTCLRCHLHPPK